MKMPNSMRPLYYGLRRRGQRTVASITDRFAALELNQILSSKSHSPIFERHRAGFINSRARVLAILFSVLAIVWACLNFAFFPLPLAFSLAGSLTLADVAFILLAVAYRWAPSIAHARLAVALLLAVSTAAFIFNNELLSGIELAEGQRIVAAVYALLPLVLVTSLGLFPLVVLELVLFIVPVLSVFAAAYLTDTRIVAPTFEMLSILVVLPLSGIVAGASSISQLQLMRVMFQETLRDPLTRAISRRSGETILQLHIAQIRRRPMPLCIAFLDLDNFKEINDQFGHEVGDGVLRCMADLLRTSLREGDTLIRWAGDEFLIIMPHANMADAGRRFNTLIARAKFPRIGNTVLTWSGGLAEWPSDAREFGWQDLVALADERMYRAKSAGRNRVLAA